MKWMSYRDMDDAEDDTAPHGCLSIVSVIVGIVLIVAMIGCATPAPKPDKTVRIDVYQHNPPTDLIGTVLKLLPLP